MRRPMFPIYIPSKGRSDSRLTIRHLHAMGVPYRVIVEEQEYADYAAVIDAANILVLDRAYQDGYDTCDALGGTKSRGPGPARNLAWDHAIASGSAWHWVMDDNIKGFFRLNNNLKVPVSDGTILRCMEDFALRYKNLAMCGPNYFKFASRKAAMAPFATNTRIYSCNLIRNDVPLRWRARYNEDTDLSLRMLKEGHCTVQFNAFLQDKANTQTIKGGNLDDFYSHEGTLPKSRMLAALHPDVCKVVWRFSRWHHHVDYHGFTQKLIRRDDITIPQGIDNYGMTLRKIEDASRTPAQANAPEAHSGEPWQPPAAQE